MVVELMASLSYAFSVLGGSKHGAQLEYNNLMDRVERLAFNALPAALTVSRVPVRGLGVGDFVAGQGRG